MNRDISGFRQNYQLDELIEAKIESDPFVQFKNWLDDAIKAELLEPNAMNLATVNEEGRPSSRIVLLKGMRDRGLIFYSNYKSRKAKDLESRPYAALNFLWKELERQVRIEGKISKISRTDSEAYFHSRPFGSQLGAVVSEQSSIIKDRSILENRYEALYERFKEKQVPLPENWGGYQLEPDYFEFWQGRESRLHDRIAFTLQGNGKWEINRLAP